MRYHVFYKQIDPVVTENVLAALACAIAGFWSSSASGSSSTTIQPTSTSTLLRPTSQLLSTPARHDILKVPTYNMKPVVSAFNAWSW